MSSANGGSYTSLNVSFCCHFLVDSRMTLQTYSSFVLGHKQRFCELLSDRNSKRNDLYYFVLMSNFVVLKHVTV